MGKGITLPNQRLEGTPGWGLRFAVDYHWAWLVGILATFSPSPVDELDA